MLKIDLLPSIHQNEVVVGDCVLDARPDALQHVSDVLKVLVQDGLPTVEQIQQLKKAVYPDGSLADIVAAIDYKDKVNKKIFNVSGGEKFRTTFGDATPIQLYQADLTNVINLYQEINRIDPTAISEAEKNYYNNRYGKYFGQTSVKEIMEVTANKVFEDYCVKAKGSGLTTELLQQMREEMKKSGLSDEVIKGKTAMFDAMTAMNQAAADRAVNDYKDARKKELSEKFRMYHQYKYPNVLIKCTEVLIKNMQKKLQYIKDDEILAIEKEALKQTAEKYLNKKMKLYRVFDLNATNENYEPDWLIPHPNDPDCMIHIWQKEYTDIMAAKAEKEAEEQRAKDLAQPGTHSDVYHIFELILTDDKVRQHDMFNMITDSSTVEQINSVIANRLSALGDLLDPINSTTIKAQSLEIYMYTSLAETFKTLNDIRKDIISRNPVIIECIKQAARGDALISCEWQSDMMNNFIAGSYREVVANSFDQFVIGLKQIINDNMQRITDAANGIMPAETEVDMDSAEVVADDNIIDFTEHTEQAEQTEQVEQVTDAAVV